MLRRISVLVCLLIGAFPAVVQSQTPTQPGPPMLRVARMSAWVDDTHPFSAVVQITNTTELALQNVSVRVGLFGRLVSRSQLAGTLDHGASTPLIGLTSDRVPDTIAPGAQRTVTFTRTVAQLGRLSRTGVYPLEIDLRSSDGTEALTTAIPYLSTDIAAGPINVGWLVSVARPSLQRADGIYPVDAMTTLAPEELTQQMDAIASHPGAGITLAPSPALLDELADMSNGFAIHSFANVEAIGAESPSARSAAAALDAIKRAAAAATEIATVPYAPADLPALTGHGLRADLLHQVTLGRSVTESRLGRAPSLSAFVSPGSRLDPDTVAAMRPLGVSGFVLAPTALGSPFAGPFQPQNFGASRPVNLDLKGKEPLPALIADPEMSLRAASQDQGVLAGQAIVAMTATAWLEIPASASERAVLIAPEQIMRPPALATALDGLASAPWVRMRTVTDILASLTPQSSSSLARIRADDTASLAAARTARRALNTLAQIVTTPPPELDGLDRRILNSESAEWKIAQTNGVALARSVSIRVGGVTRAVRVVPRQVTLTSRKGSVPVTIVNKNAFALNVRVLLASAKVAFPRGAARSVELLPPNQTVDFAIEARATGAFPIDVRVESPDGRHLLSSGKLIVRSTAVSAVALVAVGGGSVFLLLGSMRRGRRRKAAKTR